MSSEEIFRERIMGRRPQERGSDRGIACTIISAPASAEDEIFVHVTSYGPNARRGPCRWTPRPGATGPEFPQGGEQAIMHIDSDGLPWISQWWPYG